MTKRKPKHERQPRPDLCVGCGCAAAGYNYDAPSCYSCKTFFRRAIVARRVYTTCLYEGSCVSNASRRPCRSCRFERCISGGMNPHMINGIEDIESNEAAHAFSRKNYEEPSTSSSISSSPGSDEAPERALQLITNPQQYECKIEKMMQQLLYIENAHHKLRVSVFSPQILPGMTIDHLLPGPSRLGGNYEQMQTEAYEPSSIRFMPEEVIIKNRIEIQHDDFDYTTRKLWMAQDLLYSIEFLKGIPVFHLLDERSKRVLLASVLACSNITTAFYSYSQNSDRTCFPDGGVMTWSQTIQDESPNSTLYHTGIIAAMRQARLDVREYTLLKMILVCNPTLDGLSSRDINLLQKAKERYTNTLLSYVLSRVGVAQGPDRFLKLLSILNVVNRLTSWNKSVNILILAMGLHKYKVPFVQSIFHSN